MILFLRAGRANAKVPSMPDWLAVVLPFISALVGAALVFVGTLVRLRHERGMER
jgi:hypothetical protein